MVMKTRYILTVLAVSALAAAACTRDIEPAPEADSVTFEATIGQPGTKMHFAGDHGTYTEVRWEDGDRIWVRSDTQPAWEKGDCFTTSASDISSDGHSAKFTGRTRADGKICAVYPYAMASDLSDNDKVLLNIPDTQEIIPGDCPRHSIAAVAFWADGSTSFNMKYVLGAVKFSLTGQDVPVQYFELVDANTSQALHGTLEITPDYDIKDVASVTMTGKAFSNKVKLVPSEPVTLGSTPYEFYVMLPEGALAAGFTIKAYDAEGNEAGEVSTSADNSIVRGKVRTMPAAALTSDSQEEVTMEGSGTEADPFKVASADVLSLISTKMAGDAYDEVADKYFVQTEDIDMAGIEFVPIGQTSAKPFKGHYDGAGKTISNVVTGGESSDNPASGIFGYTNGAVITGVKAVGRGNSGSFVRVGGIVGHAVNTTIESCSLTGGSLEASANVVAGIAAQIDGGTVKDCSVSDVTISTTTNYAAGIVAHLPSGGTIENCTVSNATIKGVAENGGICGKIIGGTVKDCSVISTKVVGTGEDIGGIAGWTKPNTTFQNCTVSGATISSTKNYVAGIVALPEGATIIGCTVNEGTVITSDMGGTGGIAGFFKNTASTVEGCTVDGISITGAATNIGGVVGRFDLGEIKSTVVKNTSIKGIDSVGGIAGRPITSGGDCIIDGCNVEKVQIEGTIYLGGIAGYIYPDSNYLLTLANCGVKSLSITSSEADARMGGIVGWVRLTDKNSNARILNCYAHSVEGAPISFVYPSSATAPSVGGIIGYASMRDSEQGTLLIAGCTSNLTAANVNGGSVPDDTQAANIGALFGIVVDNTAATVKECAFVSDGGLTAGPVGANVVSSGIEGFASSGYAASASAKLSAFASSFSDYTLMGWTVSGGLPVLQ